MALALLAGPALAHDAPTGWAYDTSCCADRDCAPVPVGAVRAVSGGWEVILNPGEHPMVGPEGWAKVVPFNGNNIRRSKDQYFHVCIGGDGRVICLYVPEAGPS